MKGPRAAPERNAALQSVNATWGNRAPGTLARSLSPLHSGPAERPPAGGGRGRLQLSHAPGSRPRAGAGAQGAAEAVPCPSPAKTPPPHFLLQRWPS